MKTTISIFIIATLAISTVSALNCFVCNSFEDEACADKFHDKSPALMKPYLQLCPENSPDEKPFCRKTVMNIYDPTATRYHRDCGYKRREGYKCYQKRAEDYYNDICQCDEDGCNSATHMTIAPAVILAVSIFRYLF